MLIVWSTLDADLIGVTLRQCTRAAEVCAAASSCRSWHAAVAADASLIEHVTHRRFPHLKALLEAFPGTRRDFKALYVSQLNALQPPQPMGLPRLPPNHGF